MKWLPGDIILNLLGGCKYKKVQVFDCRVIFLSIKNNMWLIWYTRTMFFRGQNFNFTWTLIKKDILVLHVLLKIHFVIFNNSFRRHVRHLLYMNSIKNIPSLGIDWPSGPGENKCQYCIFTILISFFREIYVRISLNLKKF